MKITFIHPHKAFLPEIQAYTAFFKSLAVQTEVIHPNSISSIHADVEWHFLGTHFTKKKSSTLIIHEYASASVPPGRKLKDQIKKWLNAKPDFRLFLNEFVRDEFGFRDQIPYGLRNMGIDEKIFQHSPDEKNKKYDFVFSGSVSGHSGMERLLDQFSEGRMRDKTILVLSKDYEDLKERYAAFPNIIFKGPLTLSEVADHLKLSLFALNYKASIEPYLHQTSTKFLEYLACKVPVVSTDTPWLRDFHSRYGGEYYLLKDDFSNFTWGEISHFGYQFPDLTDWTWRRQISKSGVTEFLKNKFPEIDWPA